MSLSTKSGSRRKGTVDDGEGRRKRALASSSPEISYIIVNTKKTWKKGLSTFASGTHVRLRFYLSCCMLRSVIECSSPPYF